METPSAFTIEDRPDTRSKHTVYMSDELAAGAKLVAERERVRLRKEEYGWGHIVDAALRLYLPRVLTPAELASLTHGPTNPDE